MVKKDSNYDEHLAQLLSEYLDGQLPPDQSEKVEKLLAEDAQARRLLDEIRQVSQMVRQLPRVPAPEDLAEQIQLQLGRDALLGPEDTRLEPARRKYPRLRRWLAAAAMLMLTGAVVFIIYSVLIGPLPIFNPTEETPSTGSGVVAIESQPEPPAQDQPQYSLVHLQIPSKNLRASQDKLEKLFKTLNIKQVDRTRPDDVRADFAFDYPLDQLEQIVEALMADPNQYIDLIFDDDPAQPQTIIAGVDKTQLMIWARLHDQQKRNMLARELESNIKFLSNELPEWLSDEIRKTQPPIPYIRILANVPPAILPGAKEPNEMNELGVIIEPNAIMDKRPEVPTEPTPLMVKIILTLQLEREPLPEGLNIK